MLAVLAPIPIALIQVAYLLCTALEISADNLAAL